MLIVGVEVYCCTWTHSVTRTHLVGLLWMRDNTQHSKETDFYATGRIRTCNSSKRVAAEQRLRPCGHGDRPVRHHLYKCTVKELRVHRQVVELESRYRTRSMNRDLKYSNGSVATRKFQSLVSTCGERMESEWAKDTLVWPSQGGSANS